MKRLSLAAIALALFSLAPATAQTAIPYMTVDAVNVGPYGELQVTGVVQGESAPSTRSVSYTVSSETLKLAYLEACHRTLLLALSRPGQYVARVGQNLCTVALLAP